MHAFYDYVADAEGAFRLVFESDLTNEPAVRARVDRVTTECAKLIAHVIADDTGLPEEQSQLLAVSLVGMGQVSARFWLGRRPATASTWPRRPQPGRRPGLARHRRLPPHRRRPLTAPLRPSGTVRADHDHRRSSAMEVKIGVQNASRELSIDTTMEADDVEKAVAKALDGGLLVLTDARAAASSSPARSWPTSTSPPASPARSASAPERCA